MNEKLIILVSEVLNIHPDKIGLNTLRNEVEEWDSLAHIRMVSEIEDQLDAVIPFEEVSKINRISDFLVFLPG